MAVGGAVAVVLAVAAAVAARPSDAEPAAAPPPVSTPAQATNLSTDGSACVTGPDRPVLDTAYPILSASFTGAPGQQNAPSTFQIRGLTRATDQDVDLAGEPAGRTASLDFHRLGPLAHGASYRWRVRGAPEPDPGGAGWSSWCEFTIPATTPDALDLDDGRTYTVVLPTARWQAMLQVLGPVSVYVNGDRSAHAPIEDAVKSASPSAPGVPVTLNGSRWKLVANDLAYTASERDGSSWDLVDLLSTALDGPARLTMGFSRP